MEINKMDLLRKIVEYNNEEIQFRLFDSTIQPVPIGSTHLAKRHGFIEQGSLLAGLIGAEAEQDIRVDIREIFKDIWDLIASFTFNGEKVCERKSYGKPMEALDESFFEQGEYDKFVEEELLAQKQGREVIVPQNSERLSASIMKEFIEWRNNGGE